MSDDNTEDQNGFGLPFVPSDEPYTRFGVTWNRAAAPEAVVPRRRGCRVIRQDWRPVTSTHNNFESWVPWLPTDGVDRTISVLRTKSPSGPDLQPAYERIEPE